MTLWQASLHTCQLVGDIYPLINAPTLIGISASLFFILFLLLHTLQDIKLFLFFSDRLLFSLWATGCSGRTGRFSALVVAKGWVFKSWHFLKQESWRSFFFFFPTSTSRKLLCNLRKQRSHSVLHPGDSRKKFKWVFLSPSRLKSSQVFIEIMKNLYRMNPLCRNSLDFLFLVFISKTLFAALHEPSQGWDKQVAVV